MLTTLTIDYLGTLRAVAGYLGEKEQFGWWPCSFFDPSSAAFLTPAFGRTAALARCTAVTAAACRVHDEFLGAGSTFHLFRLPDELEQDIHAFLADPKRTEPLVAVLAERTRALGWLAQAGGSALPGAGPVLVGDLKTLRMAAAWQQAAACYAAAFTQGSRIYPYFLGRSL